MQTHHPSPDSHPPSAPRPQSKTAWGWLGAGALALLAKGKLIFGALKALPFAKFLLTSGSMALMIWAYAARGGFAFAVGFVALIFVHEMGHAFAMRSEGIRASWPVFIPFFGAFISMKDQPSHPTIEARVALAGPLAGTAAALACAAIGLVTHHPLFLSLAYTGFFLNLFNLIPLGFLDGARVARVFSRGAWIVGAILLGGLFFVSPSPQLLIIGALGLMHGFGRSNEDLKLVTPEDQRVWAFRYFGLCFFLGAAVLLCQRMLAARGW